MVNKGIKKVSPAPNPINKTKIKQNQKNTVRYPSVSCDSGLSWMKFSNLFTEGLVREQLPSEGIPIKQLGFDSVCFQAL